MEEKPKKLSFLRREFVKKKFMAKPYSYPIGFRNKKSLCIQRLFLFTIDFLSESQFPEIIGTVKIGLFDRYRRPAQIMRQRRSVGTFIEISREDFSGNCPPSSPISSKGMATNKFHEKSPSISQNGLLPTDE